MRLLNLYCVLDTRAKAIIGPIVHHHNAVPVIRQITEATQADKGLIANSPEDFNIIHIGMIDDETGELYSIAGTPMITEDGDHKLVPNEPVIVANALALRPPQQ